MDTAADTSVEVWLDEQTLEELRPPCDTLVAQRPGHSPCESAAEWACWINCDNCDVTRLTLHCSPHERQVAGGGHTCRLCQAGVIRLVTAERL